MEFTDFEFKTNDGRWVPTSMESSKAQKVIERLEKLTQVRLIN